jgi:hypothetical protein
VANYVLNDLYKLTFFEEVEISRKKKKWPKRKKNKKERKKKSKRRKMGKSFNISTELEGDSEFFNNI